MFKTALGYIQAFFSSVLLFYLLTAGLIALSVNFRECQIARLNDLLEYSAYPRGILKHKLAKDEYSLRHARRYYLILAKLLDSHFAEKFKDAKNIQCRAYAMAAFCDYYLGNFTSAIKLYERSLRLEPDENWIKFNLGLIYYRLRNYDKALPYLLKAYQTTFLGYSKQSMQDQVASWDALSAKQYTEAAAQQMRYMIFASSQMVIVGYEKTGQPQKARLLALAWLRISDGKEDSFFMDHAQIKPQSLELDVNKIKPLVNIAYYFVDIGRERLMAGKVLNHSLFRSQ